MLVNFIGLMTIYGISNHYLMFFTTYVGVENVTIEVISIVLTTII